MHLLYPSNGRRLLCVVVERERECIHKASSIEVVEVSEILCHWATTRTTTEAVGIGPFRALLTGLVFGVEQTSLEIFAVFSSSICLLGYDIFCVRNCSPFTLVVIDAHVVGCVCGLSENKVNKSIIRIGRFLPQRRPTSSGVVIIAWSVSLASLASALLLLPDANNEHYPADTPSWMGRLSIELSEEYTNVSCDRSHLF